MPSHWPAQAPLWMSCPQGNPHYLAHFPLLVLLTLYSQPQDISWLPLLLVFWILFYIRLLDLSWLLLRLVFWNLFYSRLLDLSWLLLHHVFWIPSYIRLLDLSWPLLHLVSWNLLYIRPLDLSLLPSLLFPQFPLHLSLHSRILPCP